jgi:hypothetical protein
VLGLAEIGVHSTARSVAMCCAVLCCAVLCCAVLCCAVLCCAVQAIAKGRSHLNDPIVQCLALTAAQALVAA